MGTDDTDNTDTAAISIIRIISINRYIGILHLLEGLNKEQAAAVQHTTGPLLIVAGAGTGKTTVITRRIAHLIHKSLAKPEEIVALTFTEKAAGEMQERVDLLLPVGYYDQWICTFHGFCERILKIHALDIGIPNDFTLLDNVQQWILVHKHFEKFKLKYYRPLGNPSKFIDALLSHFSRCKDEVISPQDYLEHAQSLRLSLDTPEKTKKKKTKKTPPLEQSLEAMDSAEIERLEELAGAYHTYQKLLLDNNFLDFGDLINYTLKLFKERPNILNYYQKKFKFLMVDEFQDTNYAQYELVNLLAGKGKNVVVVGDDDQSIYKFRGASVSNIIKFKEDYNDFQQITLVENYRSTQKILDFAYNFIQKNNPERLEVKLGIEKTLHANIEQTGTIEVIEGTDLVDELDKVAKKILTFKSANQDSWNEYAILLRRNAAANELLPILASYDIPYTFVANKGLYKKPIVLDLLAYLQLLADFHDSQSLYRVLTLPKFALPHTELSTLLHLAHKKALSLFEVLGLSQGMSEIAVESKAKIQSLLDFLQKHAKLGQTHHAVEVLVQVIKDLGIEEKIKEDTLENVQNREFVEQFYKRAELFQQQEDDKSLHNFMERLRMEQEAGNDGEIKFDPNIGPETVKVMTVHSSKGLEFKYVFVINMVDQRFPTREKGDPIEIPDALVKEILPEGDFHLQEERRLFYVAATRAKTHLFLSWAKDYGGSRPKKPSVFLLESGLVQQQTKSEKPTGKVVFSKPLRQTAMFYVPPTHFSYSQLNDFQNCPLKYKYQHYLKLPVPGNCYLSFGQTVHKVFEEFLKTYKTNLELPQQDLFGGTTPVQLPQFSYLEQLYEKHWVDDWYRDKKEKQEYRDLGKQLLRTFYEGVSGSVVKPKYIEQSFNLPLGDYTFGGKIDRADQLAEGIAILDYKTGKAPKSGDKKKDLDQLYIYQWAAQEYLHEKVARLQYWYLAENKFLEEAVAGDQDLENLKARLLEVIEKIIYTTKHNLFKELHASSPQHTCEFEHLE